jgi:nicotinate-nucleotide adenylyltransferase
MRVASRVAIYGGSFDPIHNGHLAVAEAARERFQLDEVMIVPTAHPPHRADAVASYQDRYNMVELALEGRRSIHPSKLEEPGSADKHYTIETLRRLRRMLPHDELFVIIGVDSYNNLHTWREPQALALEAELIVVSRPGSEPDAKLRLPASRVHFITDIQQAVSASQIRAAVRAGESLEKFVPKAVADYIRTHHLYL